MYKSFTISMLLLGLFAVCNGEIHLEHNWKDVASTIASVFGPQCKQISSEPTVSASVFLDEQCYFSTENDNLSWTQAWQECESIWPKAKLAWFNEPLEEKMQKLIEAGLTGLYRIAYIKSGVEEGHFVYDRDDLIKSDNLTNLCNSAVTGKASIFHDGSCYVYWDEGVAPSNFYGVDGKCTGHVPGYIGHLAWPGDSQLYSIVDQLVGGMDSGHFYWLGATNSRNDPDRAVGWKLVLH